MSERLEALKRIPLSIVYRLVLGVLGTVADVVWSIQFAYTLIYGKRHKGLAEFYNQYVSYSYKVNRYIGFVTNKRPELIDLEEIEPVDI